MPYRPLKLVSAHVLLALAAGCAALPGPPVKMLPPAELLQACQEPPGDAQTNGSMAVWLQGLRGALAACNADKAALREWAARP